MIKSDSPILKCFWLPENYFNICTTGANQNTIYRFGKSECNIGESRYFKNVFLPKLRETIIPYSGCKFLKKSKKYSEGFREVVNDALQALYQNECGYVFNIEQLSEVLKFVPDLNAILDDGIYYVSKGN